MYIITLTYCDPNNLEQFRTSVVAKTNIFYDAESLFREQIDDALRDGFKMVFEPYTDAHSRYCVLRDYNDIISISMIGLK